MEGPGEAAAPARSVSQTRTVLQGSATAHVDERVLGVVRFGVFEADLESRELHRRGVRVRLQDQPFQILMALLDCPGAVVMRAALRDRLWPDGTFVDFEHGLNAAVKRLRTALGDTADNPRFVETLHRRGYRFIAPVETTGPHAPPRASLQVGAARVTAAAVPEKIRIAVLPFVNLSQDPDQEYFSDGLTEEMIAQLGRVRPERLGVIARTSAARFKRSGRSIDEIGRELRVAYVVEGAVRQSGGRVRITTQLVDATDQTNLWSDTYDGTLTDCFALQAEVASRVARALAVELLPKTAASVANCCTEHVGAYQAYLKGRYHWNTLSVEASERALAYYNTAIDLDPGFARAHGALARAQVRLVEYRDRPIRPMLEAARDSALRALQLDPSLAWGHLALASVKKRLDWDWDGAESHYRQALALSPNCESVHYLYGRFLAAMNRPVEARALSARACEIDPLCLVVTTSDGWVHYVARNHDDAIRAARHVLDMDPDFEAAHRLLGATYLEVRRFADAVDHLRRAAELEARHPVTLTWLAHGLASTGQIAEAETLLGELTAAAPTRYVSPYRLALVHTGLGNVDAAFAALDAAYNERAVGIINLAVEPRFDPLRRDPRFDRLIRRVDTRLPELTAHTRSAASHRLPRSQ